MATEDCRIADTETDFLCFDVEVFRLSVVIEGVFPAVVLSNKGLRLRDWTGIESSTDQLPRSLDIKNAELPPHIRGSRQPTFCIAMNLIEWKIHHSTVQFSLVVPWHKHHQLKCQRN